MSIRSERFEYDTAKPEDSEEILKVLESTDFKGSISVLYTRRPDPLKSYNVEGDKYFMPVVRDSHSRKICGVGCCVIRKGFINGEEKNIGYLTGMKVLPEFQKIYINISRVYKQIFKETENMVDIYYTTILKDNDSVQKMLEKKRENMPEYRTIGDYTVYCFRTGRKKHTPFTITKGLNEECKEYLSTNLKKSNLSPIDLERPGLSDQDFYFMKDESGEIIASCGVWNQQSFKQYIVTGYSGVYNLIKKLPLKLIGYPDFPIVNTIVNYGCITGFCIKNNNIETGRIFLEKVAQEAVCYNFLMFGLLESHPLNKVFKNIRHIKYYSKAYSVHKIWGEENIFDNRPINIEVGLL
ncbi:MAG: hypothetical protein KBH06_10665 [Spirochaetes bacterium]|nr:hypothetical protein [Spirochaetota bacterium]